MICKYVFKLIKSAAKSAFNASSLMGSLSSSIVLLKVSLRLQSIAASVRAFLLMLRNEVLNARLVLGSVDSPLIHFFICVSNLDNVVALCSRSSSSAAIVIASVNSLFIEDLYVRGVFLQPFVMASQ